MAAQQVNLLEAFPAVVFAAGSELLQGGLALAIGRSRSKLVAIVPADTPEMVVLGFWGRGAEHTEKR
ncbi:MAG: hypothetical protein ACP5E9_06725 [Candidatus Methanospirareceae archaeon]